jgi:glycosyltransferase involved in cell wall biosynthesis
MSELAPAVLPVLKLLHIIVSVDPRGGGPIEGILRQNEAVLSVGRREIVSLDPPDAPFLRDFPVKVYPLGIGRFDPRTFSNRVLRFSYSPRLVPWLREHANEYDCVVVNGLWNYASVGASRILPKLRTPYVVFTHGMLDPWFRTQNPLKHLLKQAFWLAFEGRLLHNARGVLFTSEEERRRTRGEFWGYAYRDEVVGYGSGDVRGDAAEQVLAFRRATPGLGDRPYLLSLCRIHPIKGCDLLVRAFARVADRHPELDLVIAGPDQIGWLAKLQRIARELGLERRIHWPGMLTGDSKWGALRGADAFVLPSHHENFGIAVAESLACGVPTLITDKVNIWREIDAAKAGLVAADDQNGIDDLLARFLEMDSSAQAHMRAAARTCYEAHFDMRMAAQTMLQTIRSLS